MKKKSRKFFNENSVRRRGRDAANKKIAVVCLSSLLSLSVFAKEQTVTLNVPTMNCVTCPFTVKKALQNVEYVSKAEVFYSTKLAVVTFDDEKTTVKALTEATTNAGYPSTVKQQVKGE
jgi:mercuric ion binding protein